ncbi:GNAT family N-acetyltransferase [Paenibacillus tuaregi]|uniref:GNAT family N-acetyltransferase n=1 Tax=Paenibacillus tuaregi TaxID=1816681 RepID=UPI000A4813CA|nr:GNAT family N-acetyltransferase [Paenibacillus tuaregi]
MKDYKMEDRPVWLEPYDKRHLPGLERYELPREQLQFTGMPIEMLALAETDSHRHPVIIMSPKGPVGFFILYDGHEVAEYTDHPAALILRAFSVNYALQGKGYAKQGLLQLEDYIRQHFPGIAKVVLAVNEQNGPAQALYAGVGFEDEGRIRTGPIGRQFILSKLVTGESRLQD